VRTSRALIVAAFLAMALSAHAGEIAFEDVTERVGLAAQIKGWRVAHGAAWGDVDGDGRPDLYLAAFADRPLYGRDDAPIPNPLFLNTPKGFVLSPDKSVRLEGERARTTMPLFVDLDNDGDLDLVLGNHAARTRQYQSVVLENTGGGRFRDATVEGRFCPRPWAVRNITALDVSGDGLLDLLFTDGNYRNWRVGTGRLLVLRNKGKWEFEDATADYGLPDKGTAGMGTAVADVNNDGAFDVLVADSNRLFLSDGKGGYRTCRPDVFVRPKGEGHACGAALGDLNGDDLLDVVLTVHDAPGEFYVYLNKGIKDGTPAFELIAEGRFPREGKGTGLPVKAAHVSLCDVDNDGRRDVLIAVVRVAEDGKRQPLVLRNEGNKDGVPRFDVPPLESCAGYYAPGPVGDYDRDGRLDVFLPTWYEELPCYLFRNVTEGGHWLTVRVKGEGPGLNAMGIGAVVRVYAAGKAGEAEHMIGRHDVSIGNGYSSGEEALAHFGLGEAAACDLVVRWGERRVVKTNVAADRLVTVEVTADQ